MFIVLSKLIVRRKMQKTNTCSLTSLPCFVWSHSKTIDLEYSLGMRPHVVVHICLVSHNDNVQPQYQCSAISSLAQEASVL